MKPETKIIKARIPVEIYEKLRESPVPIAEAVRRALDAWCHIPCWERPTLQIGLYPGSTEEAETTTTLAWGDPDISSDTWKPPDGATATPEGSNQWPVLWW